MANRPPFPIPLGKAGHWQEVAINPYSDGDVKHWPGKPLYRPVPEDHYRITCATAWVEAQGLKQPGVNYYLNQLPDGYGLYEQDGPSAGVTYKRLFGHPGGRYYDSAKRFQPHFLWLMGGLEVDCECVLCSGKKPVAIPRQQRQSDIPARPREPREGISREVAWLQREDSSVRSKSATGLGLAGERDNDFNNLLERRQLKAADPAIAIDEEGTDDIYKAQIMELSRFRHLKARDNIKEKYSFDYQAERKSLPAHLTQISLQHSFIPRIGELVLWCPYFPDELDLVYNPDTGSYQFYSFDQEQFLGFPNWHGGVIAAVPVSAATDGPIDFPDILSNPKKKSAYTTSGFRVETFPDPNNDTDKSLSKQYKYVPLRQIRPLSHWQTLLRGIPENKLDLSIKYALTGMTTINLLEKFYFTGDWPNATIHCKGIYLGAELLLVGDAVRIFPPLPSQSNSFSTTPNIKSYRCTDVLTISSIRLNLNEITNEHALPTSPNLSTTSSITLLGKAYTLDPRRDYRIPIDLDTNLSHTEITLPPPLPLEDVKSTFPTVGAKSYGDWFPVHPPNKKYEISFDRVLGRMHEADAIRLWTGVSQTTTNNTTAPERCPTLSHDLPAILAARHYATQRDERIPAHPHNAIAWFWADTRVQALNVETFNGYEVGRYDLIRDKETLRAWRATLRVIDGIATATDVSESGLPRAKGRRKGARLVDGRIVYPGEEGDMSDDVGSGIFGGKKNERALSLGGGNASQGTKLSTALGSSQMMRAGLARDSEDESTDEVGGGISTGDAGVGSGVEDTDMLLIRDPAQDRPKHVARKHADKGKKVVRTKAQIMRSVEDDQGVLDEDEDDYDEEILKELEGPLPIARGGTVESEGGDYNPLLESFTKSRRSSSGPREKRMRY